MRKNKGLIFLLGLIVLIASPSLASAALTIFTDPVAFANQGTIIENYGYEDFPTSGVTYPGDPWTAHGVTYTTGQNVIISSGLGWSPSNAFINNNWAPITADIDGASQFSMFGFDLGYFGEYSLLSLDIYTNLNTYNLPNFAPGSSSEFNFYGAVADSGEFFTGFRIGPEPGTGPMLDNVRLGYAGESVVPEPATLSLLGLGLVGLLLKKKRTA